MSRPTWPPPKPQPHLSITSPPSPLYLTLILTIYLLSLSLIHYSLHSLDFFHLTASVCTSACIALGDRQKGAFGGSRGVSKGKNHLHTSQNRTETLGPWRRRRLLRGWLGRCHWEAQCPSALRCPRPACGSLEQSVCPGKVESLVTTIKIGQIYLHWRELLEVSLVELFLEFWQFW